MVLTFGQAQKGALAAMQTTEARSLFTLQEQGEKTILHCVFIRGIIIGAGLASGVSALEA